MAEKVAPNVAGASVVDQLQILDADLPRRLRDVRDLLVAMRIRQPVEDRHGHVLGSEGSHALRHAWLSVVRAMELSSTSWTSVGPRAHHARPAQRSASSSNASRAPCSALRKRIAALAAATLSSRNGN